MKNFKRNIVIILTAFSAVLFANAQTSEVWVADNGNGAYRNPVLYADYSDPDVCRVGSDYYMTSSSFNCIPGLQILHSKDLVNWKLTGAAIPYSIEPRDKNARPQHGNLVWAPSIRYHNKMFYIFWGDPDYGIYMTKAADPAGVWSEPALVKEGKGLIDATPLWDDDGRVYLVHAYAGSRAGLKSVLAVCELSADASKAITEDRIVYDGHGVNETVEGPKFYKRNGLYYIFAPAGGVATGWQLAFRSKSVYGPYEVKTVLAQGNTSINGPHQGAWIDTDTGEDWFLHFRDIGAYGRVIYLEPMKWVDGWPVIGIDSDGDGCGEPVETFSKPRVSGKSYPVVTPAESDDFDDTKLGLQWQWHANFNPKWIFNDAANSRIRLYSYPVPDDYKNLWDVSNLLLQKTPAPSFTVKTKLAFRPTPKYSGERTGLLVMGLDYGALVIENTPDGLVLSQVECKNADRGNRETVLESVKLKDSVIYLSVTFNSRAQCKFGYSFDNANYTSFGSVFQAREGKWIGAKVGVFCTRPAIVTNDGGWVDVDWFNISYPDNLTYAVRMADSEMKRYPEPWQLDFQKTLKWDYSAGVELQAFLNLYEATGDVRYKNYAIAYADTFVNDDGSIKTYRLEEYSVDRVNTGKIFFRIYEYTGNEKYRKAIDLLRSQMFTHPRNEDGGFWHKKVYPNQMWLDGLYMAQPFIAEYAVRYNRPEDFTDVINQFVTVARHTYDPATGLYRHACDVSRRMFWADSVTGQSKHAWGRALGWYVMAIVDALDFIPANQPGRDSVLAILNNIAFQLKRIQDPATGLWYQVLDRSGDEGNYLESSCSAMFIYSLYKALRKGYIDKSYREITDKAYSGFIKQFIETDANGLTNLTRACAVAGLGGANNRSGTYDYYINELIRSNDPKAVGPFINAMIER